MSEPRLDVASRALTHDLPHPGVDTTDSQSVPAPLVFLLALSCGIVVASDYYVQPLVGLISRSYGLPVAASGVLVTVTQAGYAAGLLLAVPLGDIIENRRLILTMLAALVASLALAAVAPDAALFLAASLAIGISSSAVQIIVPFAGHLASDATRGRIVGNVVSGLLFGIMLSRPVASLFAHVFGAHSIFAASAIVVALLVVLLFLRLPERRPQGMPYLEALASLGPLLAKTETLHRRGAYQAAMFGAFSLFWTASPLLLEGPRFHFSQIGIGLFALVGAGGALVSPWAGRAADSGHTQSITLASLAAGALSFSVAILGGTLTSWPLLVIAAVVLDIAVAANLVVGQRAIFALGAAARGRLNGLYLALFFVGGAIGSSVAGLAFARGGWTAASLVGMVFPVAALAYFATERGTD